MNKVQINNMPTLTYSTEEAINRLRVNLNFQAKDVKKIMVISSTENEGKSFVAFHTWKQMAESGVHTLLLDTDLRKSVMAEKYQMEAENGKKAHWYIPCAFQRYAVKRCCMAHDYAAGGYFTKRRKPGKPGNALRERDIPPSSG